MPAGSRQLHRMIALGVVGLLGAGVAAPGVAIAQGAPTSMQPKRFYGIVKRVPAGGAGLWVIGLETVDSDHLTVVDEYYGPLVFGSCAVVDIRQGKARRIASARVNACMSPPARDPPPKL